MTALLTADEAARLRPGERLVIVRAGDERRPDWWDESSAEFVAPQAWVALTGPCPTCGGTGVFVGDTDCPDCRDGRRIVPLYTECPECGGSGDEMVDSMTLYGIPGGFDVSGPCPRCNNYDVLPTAGRVLVGRGSIDIVPVVERFAGSVPRCIKPCATDEHGRHYVMFRTKTLVIGENNLVLTELASMPVPGRDFGVVIDCVEVAGG